MSTALVLGGGGPVGIAWQAGLLIGLDQRGAGLAGSDLVVGTSAGSVVGAALTAGLDLATLPRRNSGTLPLAPGADGGIGPLLALAAERADDPPGRVPVRIVDHALTADTVAEDEYLGIPLFAQFDDVSWPPAFRCTAIDLSTRTLRVWDVATGPRLSAALAASCAVPGLFPPVTVDSTKHIDGGLLNPLNVLLGRECDHIIAVSCFAVSGTSSAIEIESLQAEGKEVTIIEPGPEFLALTRSGLEVMNTALVDEAFDIGLRQSEATETLLTTA